jgi:hypothetical protein
MRRCGHSVQSPTAIHSPMSRPLDTVSASKGSLIDLARRGLDWWLDEIRAMVPARLMARAETRRRIDIDMSLLADGRVSVQFGETPPVVLASADLAAPLRELAGAADAPNIRLDVPTSLCLVRRSTLPRRSLRDARLVLLNELAETTPMSEASVHSDWYVEAEDPATGLLHLNHVILSRALIAPLTALLAQNGLRFCAITVGRSEGRPKPVDLLSDGEIGFRAFLRQQPRSLWIMAGLAAAMILVLPVLLSLRFDREIAALQASRANLTASARKLAALDEGTLNEAARLAALPRASALLDAVGDHLPPETYLTRLNLQGNRLELRLATPLGDKTASALAAAKVFAPDPAVMRDGVTLRILSSRDLAHD